MTKMKNKFLLLLIALSALLACGKQQPWNPNPDESQQKKAVKNLANSDNSRQTKAVKDLTGSDNSQQKKAVEDLAGSDNQQAANSENLAGSNNNQQATNSENLAGSDNSLQAETLQRVSFDEVKPLFEKHCMLCHRGVPPIINWLDENTAKEYVENGKLYNRIWELKDDPMRGMPLGNAFGMTEEERQKIVEWLEGESAQ